MKRSVILWLIVLFSFPTFLAFSQWTLKEIILPFPKGTTINKAIWNGKNLFLLGESNAKKAIFGKFDLFSNKFVDLSNLLPSSYISLNGGTWNGKELFLVGIGSKKAVMAKYTPSTNSFNDLTVKMPRYWEYNLAASSNGKILVVVGESASGSVVMGTYNISNGIFSDHLNEINEIGFLNSISTNKKSFLAVGKKTTMPQRALIFSYDPSFKKITNLSTFTANSTNYLLGLKDVVWDGKEYLFVGDSAFGRYKDNFEDLSYKLKDIHLLSFPANSKYEYGKLNGIEYEDGICVLFGNGLLAVYNLKNGVIKGVKSFIDKYKYVSLESVAWDGKEFFIVGNENGNIKAFILKP